MHPPRKDTMSVRPKQTTVPEKPTSLQRVLAAQKKRREVETGDFWGWMKRWMKQGEPTDPLQLMMSPSQEKAYNTYVNGIGIFDSNTFFGFLKMQFHQQEQLLAIPPELKTWVSKFEKEAFDDNERREGFRMQIPKMYERYYTIAYIQDRIKKHTSFNYIKYHFAFYLEELCNKVREAFGRADVKVQETFRRKVAESTNVDFDLHLDGLIMSIKQLKYEEYKSQLPDLLLHAKNILGMDEPSLTPFLMKFDYKSELEQKREDTELLGRIRSGNEMLNVFEMYYDVNLIDSNIELLTSFKWL